MMLAYSIYLVRAVVSMMVAIFLVFIKEEAVSEHKYEYANIGIAIAALLDCCMDLFACWMLLHGMDIYEYHWVWVPIYYIEWTVLGYCVLKLVGSSHKFYYFPPLLVYYVVADSLAYRSKIDDNFAGTQNEKLHELSYYAFTYYILYLVLTIVDLAAFRNNRVDLIVVFISTVVVVLITIKVFNLKPLDRVGIADMGASSDVPDTPLENLETRVKAWESREDKPFCEESISLQSVADELRVSPRTLSSYINSVKMLNFNMWVNGLRVEVIKQLIKSNPSIDVYDLMVESGFQSRASLARAVKTATGMTVTQLKCLQS